MYELHHVLYLSYMHVKPDQTITLHTLATLVKVLLCQCTHNSTSYCVCLFKHLIGRQIQSPLNLRGLQWGGGGAGRRKLHGTPWTGRQSIAVRFTHPRKRFRTTKPEFVDGLNRVLNRGPSLCEATGTTVLPLHETYFLSLVSPPWGYNICIYDGYNICIYVITSTCRRYHMTEDLICNGGFYF